MSDYPRVSSANQQPSEERTTCALALALACTFGLHAGCVDEPPPTPMKPVDAPDEEAPPADEYDEQPEREEVTEPSRPSPVVMDGGARRLDAGRDAERGRSANDGASADARPLGDARTEPDANANADASDGEARRCTGKPGAKRGKSVETVRAGRATRKFVMHRPASLDPNTPAPIVIVPHGYTQNGEDMYRITKYWEIGEKEGVVTLYPDGASAAGPWNVGRPTCQSVFGLLPLGSGDDQAFLDAMVEHVEADQCVDREHVFVAGFSMGGYFANETGCKSELVRAIAPHSAGSYDLAACPAKPKPVIMFHGNDDKLIPYDCGKQTRERWLKRNGCDAEVETRKVENGTCEYHKGCTEGAQVAFCTFDAMNHGWAGGPTAQVPAYPDDYPKYESSTQVSWEFFKKYAW